MTSATRGRLVAVNDRGLVIGQDHHRAKLSDHEVWLIRELAADGVPLREIAGKFECSYDTVKAINCGRKRGQVMVGQKRAKLRSHKPLHTAAHPDEFDVINSIALSNDKAKWLI